MFQESTKCHVISIDTRSGLSIKKKNRFLSSTFVFNTFNELFLSWFWVVILRLIWMKSDVELSIYQYDTE